MAAKTRFWNCFNGTIKFAAHHGRIVKLIGDGTIVEFASVVDAVNCALSVQRSGDSLQDESLHRPKIVLRMGINLGDVIIEGDDIYGDGVNIAARLEPVAEPGRICISSIVNESIGNRIDVRFEDGLRHPRGRGAGRRRREAATFRNTRENCENFMGTWKAKPSLRVRD